MVDLAAFIYVVSIYKCNLHNAKQTTEQVVKMKYDLCSEADKDGILSFSKDAQDGNDRY